MYRYADVQHEASESRKWGCFQRHFIWRTQSSVITDRNYSKEILFKQVICLLDHRGSLLKTIDLWIIDISEFARKQSNLNLSDLGMRLTWGPVMDGDREGTACIAVRHKNTRRLVKHPDSLWETSAVWSGYVAKAFPSTLTDMWRSSSLSISWASPSLSPFNQRHEFTSPSSRSVEMKICLVLRCQTWDELEFLMNHSLGFSLKTRRHTEQLKKSFSRHHVPVTGTNLWSW